MGKRIVTQDFDKAKRKTSRILPMAEIYQTKPHRHLGQLSLEKIEKALALEQTFGHDKNTT